MRIDTIPTETWTELENRHPAAYHLLLHASLVGERKALENELKLLRAFNDPSKAKRVQWILERIQELSHIK